MRKRDWIIWGLGIVLVISLFLLIREIISIYWKDLEEIYSIILQLMPFIGLVVTIWFKWKELKQKDRELNQKDEELTIQRKELELNEKKQEIKSSTARYRSKKDNENQKIQSVFEPLRDYLQDDYMKDLVKAYSCYNIDRDYFFLGGSTPIILELDFKRYLKEGIIIDDMRMKLKDKGLILSDKAIVFEPYVNDWEIEDGKELYGIEFTDKELNVYRKYLKLPKIMADFYRQDLLSYENPEDERLKKDMNDLIKHEKLMLKPMGQMQINDLRSFYLSKIKKKIQNHSTEYGNYIK